MPDIQALHSTLVAIERIAKEEPDWSRNHLADLIDDFRPALSFALLRADDDAFANALERLMVMVRRFVIATSL
jgi:hypothetical protein